MVRFLIWFLLAALLAGQEPSTVGSPPPQRVVWKSLALPGWGEQSLGYSARGHVFSVSELALWTGVVTSVTAVRVTEGLYRAYASEHAGVDGSAKNHQFWVDIGNYANRDDFNQEHLRWREPERLYPAEETWDWSWDTHTHRKQYENIRISSDRWKVAGQFIAGGIVLNHILSAMDAYYLSNRARLSLDLVPGTDATGQISLRYQWTLRW